MVVVVLVESVKRAIALTRDSLLVLGPRIKVDYVRE